MKKALKKDKPYWGNLSGIRGDLSDIRGNLSDIRGNIDDCDLTPEARK